MTSVAAESPKIILGYWNIRGLAQPIRLLLTHVKAEFEDKLYSVGPAPEFDKSAWLSEKDANSFKLDFPNLPYLIDGEVKLTQTLAIMRYLGRKYKLVPTAEADLVRLELAEQQIADLRAAFGKLCYSPQYKELLEGTRSKALCLGVLDGGYVDRFTMIIEEFAKFLGDRQWFVGDELTYVDFLAYELLFQLSKWNEAVFKNAETLLKFVARFEALPEIAAYLKSDRYIKWPFNNNVAQYGSRSQPCPF